MENDREQAPDVTITDARVLRDKLLVYLSDGSVRAVALRSIPALAQASDEQAANVSHGSAEVGWPALQVRLTLADLWALPITSTPPTA